MNAAFLLLHMPDPVGWIALPPDALRDAQAAAREVLGVGARRRDNLQAVGATTLLPAEDAARLLSVEPSWLLRQAREGRMNHVRIGKYIRFDPQDIVGRCTRQAVTRGSAIRTA